MSIKISCLLAIIALYACSTSLQSSQSAQKLKKTPTNIIFLIGDGMGLSHISAANYSSKKTLAIDQFSTVGLQKTSCKDKLITDSAASAAAMARGIKANYNTFGSDLNDRAPKSILEEAEALGMATGITVTSSLTHATPAAFVTYQESRSLNEGIAADYLDLDVDYLVGGGKKFFDRRQNDDRDLLHELKAKNYQVRSYLDLDIDALNIDSEKNFVYFTADSEPLSHMAGREYFVPACSIGLSYLDRKTKSGFFYLIESSQIDWAGHANEARMVIDELLEFDKVIKNVIDFARKDGNTLVILTADHETGGLAIIGENKKHHLDIAFSTKQHTATMVPIFAFGPGSEQFAGVYENTEIFHKLMKLMHGAIEPSQKS